MILYSIYNGDDSEYFSTKTEAVTRADELARYASEDESYGEVFEVRRLVCNSRPSKRLILDMLNRQGFVSSSKVVYSITSARVDSDED